MPPERSGVVLTGIGMRAALGGHAVQVAASVRAGLSRLREWSDYETRDGPLVTAFTDPNLGDRAWPEKALELLQQPLAEALAGAQLADFTEVCRPNGSGRARAYVATPYADRPGTGEEAFKELGQTLGEDLFGEGVSVPLELVAMDHAAGAVATARACEALQRGEADWCIVSGVDSFLEGGMLDALLAADRLKTRSVPSGLIPGEGGAVLVLETATSARRRKAPVLAHIDAVALEREEARWSPEAPVSGRALVRAIERATDAAGGPAAFTRVIADLNGERWRFLEWALAESRLSDHLPRGWRLWHPADAMGDVGAAFCPVAAGLAVRAFARRYAGGGKVLVVASSERGERAALALAAAEGS
jgi:3-oxoacyl-[acyl-carrier-protein] synthase-1